MIRQLEYAATISSNRRRIWRSALVITTVNIAIALGTWRTALWNKARLLYWQHQCLTYEMPPDKVVHDNDISMLWEAVDRGSEADPSCLTTFERLKYGPSSVPGLSYSAPLIFMHELVSETGVRRMVIVRKSGGYSRSFDPFDIGAEIAVPAGWSEPARPIPSAALWISSYGIPSVPLYSQQLRLYAGQIDANDPSRFTILYESKKTFREPQDGEDVLESGIVEGRLVATGSDVLFTESVISRKTLPRKAPRETSSQLPLSLQEAHLLFDSRDAAEVAGFRLPRSISRSLATQKRSPRHNGPGLRAG